ncbi:CHAT domain-containing protein [Allonocardiopsis opalescens]|uniref:CHAT domain-containing protein n=1 Tax=Allonocardiopsis opalescens TaxID=1144618 RepID=A0A2T0Q975_9ACTN|nr:CHAT domain-containing protein [Allonocardiopsis opalescens]PRY00403.1 CHAT domain-containing protein [Allonocardiopsis opalescens]
MRERLYASVRERVLRSDDDGEGAAGAVLSDEAAAEAAALLDLAVHTGPGADESVMRLVYESEDPGAALWVDPDALALVAGFHFRRYMLAAPAGRDAEWERVLRVYGLLYQVDAERVPEELRPLLAPAGPPREDDPWTRAVDRLLTALDARDLAEVDAATDAFGAFLDDGSVPAHRVGLMVGLARLERSGISGLTADADAAAEWLAWAAERVGASRAEAAKVLGHLGEAHLARFRTGGGDAALGQAVAAYRSAVERAPDRPDAQAAAWGGLGAALLHRAEHAGAFGPGGELDEAIESLRRAVDAADPAAEGGEAAAAHRRALGQATGLRAQWIIDDARERWRRTPPPEPPAEAADADAESDRAQAGEINALCSARAAGAVSAAEAARRARDPDWRPTERAVASVAVALMDAYGDGAPARLLPHAAVLLDIAEARWPRDRSSVWWPVGEVFLRIARFALVDDADAALYRRAVAVADRRVDVLRRGASGADLAEALYEAGTVRGRNCAAAAAAAAPVVADTLDGDLFTGARQRWLQRRAVGSALGLTGEERPGPPLPEPEQALREAAELLSEAAALAEGPVRGDALVMLGEAVSGIAALTGTPVAARMRGIARQALDLLDPLRDPVTFMFAVRVLTGAGELLMPPDLAALLPVDLDAYVEREGLPAGAALMASVLILARAAERPDLVRAAVAAIRRHLPGTPDPDFWRRVWAADVHALPGDLLRCPDGALDPARFAPELRGQAAAEGWTRDELAATLAHLAAHAHPSATAAADALIAEALGSGLAAEHTASLLYLRGSLAEAAAAHHLAEGGDAAKAALEAARAIEAWSALGRFEDAAELLGDIGRLLPGIGADRIDEVLVMAALAAFRLVGDPGEATRWRLRDFCHQAVDRALTERYNPVVVALLHQVAKAPHLAAALRAPGPFAPPARQAARLREVGTASGGADGAEASEGVVAELLGPGHQMLMLSTRGENEPDADAGARARNARRSAGRWIDGELGRDARGDSGALVAPADLRGALPADTVLLSLFTGHRTGDDGPPCAAVRGLALTAEGEESRTLLLRDLEGGLVHVSRGAHHLWFDPLASTVAAVRREVVADPLHRDVSRTAEAALAELAPTALARFEERLAEWYAQGKRHLCVWPHGPLHYAPYGLLPVGGRVLADDWTVTMVPGIGFLGAPPPPPGTGLVAIAPGAAAGLPGDEKLERHAERIAAASGGRALTGAAATPERALAAMGGARYVHLAAHGRQDEVEPWFQRLHLAPGADGDGRLFAHQVLGADLRGVELLTMSSCESALGRFDANDNLRGLPAAFLRAGVGAVVGCLWPVHPAVADVFFTGLYARLAAGRPKAAAFRGAQREARRRCPQYRDWGAFCFIGDWRDPRG